MLEGSQYSISDSMAGLHNMSGMFLHKSRCVEKNGIEQTTQEKIHTQLQPHHFSQSRQKHTPQKKTLTNGAGGTEFPHAKEKNCTLTSQFT